MPEKEGEYIVRADYYPNGSIMPLGFTGFGGESSFIQTVKQTSNGHIKIFECTTNNGIYKLKFDGKWSVEKK